LSQATSRADELIEKLGALIAHLHVPRSLGSVMVPKEYDEVRELIGDWGWSTDKEIAAKLREALGIDRGTASSD
jgi:hypothetical protein